MLGGMIVRKILIRSINIENNGIKFGDAWIKAIDLEIFSFNTILHLILFLLNLG